MFVGLDLWEACLWPTVVAGQVQSPATVILRPVSVTLIEREGGWFAGGKASKAVSGAPAHSDTSHTCMCEAYRLYGLAELLFQAGTVFRSSIRTMTGGYKAVAANQSDRGGPRQACVTRPQVAEAFQAAANRINSAVHLLVALLGHGVVCGL